LKEKFVVLPKRIARSRKIQIRQFEPVEIWIEYELTIKDPSAANEALQEATHLAITYLDNEEMKLREKSPNLIINQDTPGGKTSILYDLRLTTEGKASNLRVIHSKNPQYSNFIHVWQGKKKNETYIGYLRKDTGEFKFKEENKTIIDQYGIKPDIHFKIIEIPKVS
jgi:hypothetical protein